ncbi:MAG: hypothetical protein M3Y31_05680 [Gemmatimonadota bacterium]|nr:hypothetical protein [Gemmatimonadota bacterium]
MSYRWGPRLLLPVFVLAAACAGDEVSAPSDPVEGSLTLNASEGWAFASLADEEAVTVADPATSSSWDIGFNAIDVMLNGGAAGPGGVTGYCVCANASATDEQVLAMTAESELADFDAVTMEDVPSAGFREDELVPAIGSWYTGSGSSAVADTRTWLVRLSNGTSFAKVRVSTLSGADENSAGDVTLEYAVQPTADAAFEPTETVVLDAAAGSTVDLATGTIDGAAWDLAVEGFTIRLNGGVSGSGSAAAAETTDGFEAVTTAVTDPRAYRSDTFGGIFTDSPWYRYNLTGEHGIHPTFDVYLVKRGADVYKVQVLDYYDPAGEPRHITFRYAKLND